MGDDTPKKLIDQKGVETDYGIPVSTQENLRRSGRFAPWLRVGHKVYYVRAELEAWISAQQANATFSTGGA